MGMKPRPTPRKTVPARAQYADPDLFLPLTEGERADALRLVTEEKKLATMVKVGRYRVVSIEPLALKPPHERAGYRCARVIIYDYAADANVAASVDLENSDVFHATTSKRQPMLSEAEEAAAIGTAVASDQVASLLALGDEVQGVMHYWSRQAVDFAFRRRTAAVLFGQSGGTPSLVAIVDMLDGEVTEVVPADRW